MSTSIAQIPLTKRCNRGENCINPLGCVLPATTQFFEYHPKPKDKLRGNCRVCSSHEKNARALNKNLTSEQIEQKRAYHRAYYQLNKDTPKTKESGRRRRRKYYENHPDKVKERNRIYKLKKFGVKPVRDHTWPISIESKLNSAIYSARYRAKKLNLTSEWSTCEWERALNAFDSCCAYCGKPQGLWNPICADHFIPLTAGKSPGTVKENMVPACRDCNSSKHNADPVEWIDRKFGKRGKQILKRIHAYFASLT